MGKETAPAEAVVVADPEMQQEMPAPPRASKARWMSLPPKLVVLGVVVVAAIVGAVVGVLLSAAEEEEGAAPLGPIGAALCEVSDECSSGECGPDGQCLCLSSADCLGELDVCENATGICITPVTSAVELAQTSERAVEGQKIVVVLEENITCTPQAGGIGIVSNRSVAVRGEQTSIGEACEISVGVGSELSMASVEVLGSIVVEEDATVNLTDVVVDMEICPFGWQSTPGMTQCLFIVSELGFSLAPARAAELCDNFLGPNAANRPVLADLISQTDRELAQSLLFDEAAWVSGQCATIDTAGGVNAAPCDSDQIRYAVCSVPKRVPISPPGAALLSQSELLVTSPESYKLLLNELLFPGEEGSADRRRLQGGVSDELNNTVVIVQRDVEFSELPLALAASADEPWQVEVELDHPCGDLVLQIGSDLNANLTEVTNTGTSTGLVVQADIDAVPGELPRFIHLFANVASCACVHRVALLKGGVPFVNLPLDFAVTYECDNRFPGIALSGDGCLLLGDAQRPDVVLPPQVALDLQATECDRFSLKQHPSAGSPYEVRVAVEGGIDSLRFEDADTSRPLIMTETAPNEFSAFLDESSRRLVTNIRVVGNATIGTPKITKVQTLFEGAQVAGWDPVDTHDCFKVCPVIHDETGVDFGVVQQMEFRIGSDNPPFNPDALCAEIDSIVTYADLAAPTPANTTSSETTCTAPVQYVKWDDIQTYMNTNRGTWRYLPVVVNVTRDPVVGLGGFVRFNVPGDIQLEVEQLDDLSIRIGPCTVSGGLELSNVRFGGPSAGSFSNSGYMLLDGCTVGGNVIVLSNPGSETRIVGSLLTQGQLVPLANSVIDVESSTFRTSFNVQSPLAEKGSVSFSRVDVEEGPSLLEDPTIGVDFLDLKLQIAIADSATDPACTSSSQPESPLFVVDSLGDCESACVSDGSCIGYFFDALGFTLEDQEGVNFGSRCGLCRPPELGGCSFNCSLPSSVLFRRESPASVANLGSGLCPVGSGLDVTLSLQDCQGWCSSTPGCGMMSYDEDSQMCSLFPVAAVTACPAPAPTRTVHIDTKVADEFTDLPAGVCIDQTSLVPIQTVTDTPSKRYCAALCAAIPSGCVAYELTVEGGYPTSCALFDRAPITTTCSGPGSTAVAVYLSAAPFPSLDPSTLIELGCNPPVSLAFFAQVVPSLVRCKAECDLDPSCEAFTYMQGQGPVNCFRFRSSALDVIFDENQCVEDPTLVTRSFLGLNRVDFADSSAPVSLSCGAQRFPALSVGLEECMAACSLLVPGCPSIAFDSSTSTCQLTCDPVDGQPVTATHVFETLPPGADFGVEYFGDVAACTEDVDLIDISDLSSTRSADVCRVLCDISSACIGFTTDASCSLVRNVALKPSTTSCSSVIDVQIAYQGKRNFDFVEAPDQAVFANELGVVAEGFNSARICQQKCVEDVACFAASLRASDQACVHFGSRKFAEDVSTPAGARPFVKYTRSFFEEAFGGVTVKGSTVLRTFSDLPRAACLRACDTMATCLSVRHDANTLACELRAGDDIAATGDVGAALAFFGRIQVNPFTEVSTDFITVCPDPTAQLVSMPPGAVFDAEACQALCEADLSCGSVVFDLASRTCKLFDGDAFVVTDTPSCRTADEVMFVSYVQFLERDSRKITDLAALEGESLDLCAGEIDGVTLSTLDPSNLPSCQVACLASRECAALVLRDDVCHLLRANHSFWGCDTSTEVLGNKYVGTSFSRINSTTCLADTASTLVNRFAQATTVPECAALCDAHVMCTAFRMLGGCELYASAATAACNPGVEEEAYARFTDKPYTSMGTSFCLASEIAAISATEEECKAACSSTFECVAVQHNKILGECILHRSAAFYRCLDSPFELFISHAHRLTSEPQTALQPFERMCFHNNYHTAADTSCAAGGTCGWGTPCSSDGDCTDSLECVPTLSSFWSGTSRTAVASVCMGERGSDKEACVVSCLRDPECRGAQFFAGTGDNVCGHLTQDVIDAMASAEAKLEDCGPRSQGFEIHLKVETTADKYRSLDGSCLRTSLEDRVGPFPQRSLLDCMAICDAFATCKHFTRSDDGECHLFGYQASDVEEGDCDTGTPGITTFVNTASFVDSVEHFGEPEYIMMELPGLSHAECAATCASLDECNAFIHDWSKHRVTGSLSSVVEPKRLATKPGPGAPSRVWEVEHDVNVPNELSGGLSENVALVDYIDTQFTRQQRIFIEEGIGNRVRVIFFDDVSFFGSRMCLWLSGSDIKVRPCTEPLDNDEVWLQGFSPDGFLVLKPLTRPLDCLSWASSSILTLAVGDCTSDTSKFELASVGLRLAASSDKANCVTSDDGDPAVSLGRCLTAQDGFPYDDSQSWTYLFSSQRWVKHPYDYTTGSRLTTRDTAGSQVCLQAASDGVIRSSDCTAANTTFALGRGGIIEAAFPGGGGQCVTAQGTALQLAPCEQGAAEQKWDRFAVCKLTTRERSGVFLMENTFAKSFCVADTALVSAPAPCPNDAVDTISLESCETSNGYLMYKYPEANDPADEFSLEWVDEFGRSQGLCLRRDVSGGGVRMGACGAIEDFPFTNWLLNPSELTFTGLDGKVLSASTCRRFAMAFDESFTQATLGYPTAWRSFENLETGGAVELSVPPTPISFQVTDPEQLFQAWLWSDFGVRSRSLLAKVEAISDTVSRLSAFVARSEQAIKRALSLLGTVDSALTLPIQTLNRLTTFLLLVDPIVLFFEKVPYVGPFIKGVRLRSVLRRGRRSLDKATKSGGRLGTAALAATAAVTGVLSRVLDNSDSLDDLPSKLRAVASLVTRLTRCAFEQANEVVQDKLNALMDKITTGIDTFQTIMGELEALLEPLSEAIGVAVILVVEPVKALGDALRPTQRILDSLQFLIDLFGFKIQISYPVGLHWRRGCFCCDCLSIKFNTFRVGLEELGEFLAWLDRTIRSIPFIGWIMDIIDAVIRGILGALFPRISIPLPDFGALERFSNLDLIGTRFSELANALNEKVDEMMSVSLEWVGDLEGLVDLAPIEDLISSFPVFEGFPECEDINCFLGPLGLPSLPSDVTDSMVRLANRTARLQAVMESPEFNQRVANLVDRTGGCAEYKEMPIYGLDKLSATLGLNESEVCRELLDNGARTIEYCSAFEVDSAAQSEADGLGAWLSTELGDLASEFDSARRRELSQDNTGTPLTFSLTFAIPLETILKCWGPQESWFSRSSKGVKTRIFRTDAASGEKAKDLQRKNRPGSSESDFSVGGPAGLVLSLESKQVLAVTIGFPLDGGFLFSFGFRLQLQLGFQYMTSWSRLFREAGNPVISAVDDEEDTYVKCRSDGAESEECTSFILEYEEAQDEVIQYELLYNPEKVNGQRKWQELPGDEQVAAIAWFERMKKTGTRTASRLRLLAREANEALNRKLSVICSRMSFSTAKSVAVQFRLSSQQGTGSVEQPFTPFAGFQVNLGSLLTFRKDFHIIPAIDKAAAVDSAAGFFEFNNRLGNAALIFNTGFLSCALPIWLTSSDPITEKWTDFKEQCDSRPDFFFSGSLHIGVSTSIFQARFSDTGPRASLFGIGAGASGDQVV